MNECTAVCINRHDSSSWPSTEPLLLRAQGGVHSTAGLQKGTGQVHLRWYGDVLMACNLGIASAFISSHVPSPTYHRVHACLVFRYERGDGPHSQSPRAVDAPLLQRWLCYALLCYQWSPTNASSRWLDLIVLRLTQSFSGRVWHSSYFGHECMYQATITEKTAVALTTFSVILQVPTRNIQRWQGQVTWQCYRLHRSITTLSYAVTPTCINTRINFFSKYQCFFPQSRTSINT